VCVCVCVLRCVWKRITSYIPYVALFCSDKLLQNLKLIKSIEIFRTCELTDRQDTSKILHFIDSVVLCSLFKQYVMAVSTLQH